MDRSRGSIPWLPSEHRSAMLELSARARCRHYNQQQRRLDIVVQACSLQKHSKQQLQPKLNMPRALGGENPSERGRADEDIGQIEIRAIEEVEELGPEL